MNGHHVVLGTGAVGLATMRALLRRGEQVRMVNRSGRADVPDGVEVTGGDASDPAFVTDVTRGARAVYQVMAPPYDRWAELFPRLQASVLEAARANGARLVSMENVYLYGRPGGRPLTETSPHDAHTAKGRLRGEMSRALLEAHARGDAEVAIGRASDYFGPGGGAQSNLGDRVMPAVLAGRTATVLGDPDQPHTYTYVPDAGEGLALLGEHPAAAGRAWHLPNDPDTRTTRQLVAQVHALAGRDRVRLRQLPPTLLRLAALRDRTVREVLELSYLFEAPFVVDSTAITELGAEPTPLAQALGETLATYRAPTE